MKQSKFPPGWNEERVRRVLAHYEKQTEEEALANIIARAMRGKKAPVLTSPLPEGPVECLELTEEEIDELLEKAIALQAAGESSFNPRDVA